MALTVPHTPTNMISREGCEYFSLNSTAFALEVTSFQATLTFAYNQKNSR